MPVQLKPILIASLVASLIFFLVIDMGLPFFCVFLSSIPLFFIGFSRGSDLAFWGAILTTFIVGAYRGPVVGFTFLLLVFLPSWFICRQAMLLRENEQGEYQWFPMVRIWLNLALSACTLVLLLTLYYMGGEQTLPDMLGQHIRTLFANFPDMYAEPVDALANRPFLIFGMAIWLWGVFLYIQTWLAQSMLVRLKQNSRPDVAFVPTPLPQWLFSLLGICGFASLFGSESLQFAGNAALMGLSMPYFFLGAATLHQVSENWANRRFFLFVLYFLIIAQFWPALFVAGYGFWQHAKTLNKHLPPA